MAGEVARGYHLTADDQLRVTLAHGLGREDTDPQLGMLGVAEMVAPYSWVDVNAVVDVTLHRSGVDPVEWPLSRLVSYYSNLEHMGPSRDESPVG